MAASQYHVSTLPDDLCSNLSLLASIVQYHLHKPFATDVCPWTLAH